MPDALDGSVTLVVVADIPASGVADFRRYEASVLALLAEHGGILERRLTSQDGTSELHIVRFPSTMAFEAYRGDPRRAAAAPVLAHSGAKVRVIPMLDFDHAGAEQR